MVLKVSQYLASNYNHSNKDNMVLAQKQICRSVKKNRELSSVTKSISASPRFREHCGRGDGRNVRIREWVGVLRSGGFWTR